MTTTDEDGLRSDEHMPCDLWGFCNPDCRTNCLANSRRDAAEKAEAARKAKLPCPHEEYVVRISCHADDRSPECVKSPQFTGFACGRPECKARLMGLVKVKTGYEAVAVRIPADVQAEMKKVPF